MLLFDKETVLCYNIGNTVKWGVYEKNQIYIESNKKDGF